MNRFQFVLDNLEGPNQITLPRLAAEFNEAVATVDAAGANPAEDPAVLVLGAWIAFHTHADVNTVKGYRQLIDLCHDRLAHDQRL